MIVKTECPLCHWPLEYDAEDYDGHFVSCPHCHAAIPLGTKRAKRPSEANFTGPIPLTPEEIKQRDRRPTSAASISIWILSAMFVLLAVWAARTQIKDFQSAENFMILLAFLAAIAFYFLPAFIGRHKRNHTAILILNLFLGWTFIGWVIALIWATMKEPEPVANK